jgi:uncharacterized membrane protein YebE (DUF533 family)
MVAPNNTPEQALHLTLAAKLLQAWAGNRQQVQAPLALNLARMEPGDRALVLRAMAVAMAARAGSAGEPAPLVEAAISRIGGTSEDALAVLADRPDLFALLAELDHRGLAAHGYAAAALLLDRRVPMERAFLDWLAARLALPPSVTIGLARRYGR